MIAILIRYLSCIKHCSKHFTYINSFNPPNYLRDRHLLLSHFFHREVNILPNITLSDKSTNLGTVYLRQITLFKISLLSVRVFCRSWIINSKLNFKARAYSLVILKCQLKEQHPRSKVTFYFWKFKRLLIVSEGGLQIIQLETSELYILGNIGPRVIAFILDLKSKRK